MKLEPSSVVTPFPPFPSVTPFPPFPSVEQLHLTSNCAVTPEAAVEVSKVTISLGVCRSLQVGDLASHSHKQHEGFILSDGGSVHHVVPRCSVPRPTIIIGARFSCLASYDEWERQSWSRSRLFVGSGPPTSFQLASAAE